MLEILQREISLKNFNTFFALFYVFMDAMRLENNDLTTTKSTVATAKL